MKKAFFIAPYRIDLEYLAKKNIVANLCVSNNLEFLIAEDIQTGNSLNAKDTLKLLNECDFAIADLSFERPSCYYEVGYLQALNKTVHLICKSNTTVHQVLQVENLITYSNLDDYRLAIEKVLKAETYGS